MWNIYTYAATAIDNISGTSQILGNHYAGPVWLETSDGKRYHFDAILREEHTTSIRTTDHPIQSGANISDHAFVLPCRLTMEIGVSDVMASSSGLFTSGPTRSVSAYQTLLQLQQARLPISIMTDLNLYKNMLIEHMNAPKTYQTARALRATVQFKEIIMAMVSTTKVSARPQTTGQTNVGQVQPEPAPSGSVLGEAGF